MKHLAATRRRHRSGPGSSLQLPSLRDRWRPRPVAAAPGTTPGHNRSGPRAERTFTRAFRTRPLRASTSSQLNFENSPPNRAPRRNNIFPIHNFSPFTAFFCFRCRKPAPNYFPSGGRGDRPKSVVRPGNSGSHWSSARCRAVLRLFTLTPVYSAILIVDL